MSKLKDNSFVEYYIDTVGEIIALYYIVFKTLLRDDKVLIFVRLYCFPLALVPEVVSRCADCHANIPFIFIIGMFSLSFLYIQNWMKTDAQTV